MSRIPESWQARLDAQAQKGLLRKAADRPEGFADFCSNDFLGLGQQPLHLPEGLAGGATGSRLVSGLHKGLEELEAWAADWLGVERVVYFPSGYQANLAVIQGLTTRHDTLVMDERVHASLRDAARQTLAEKIYFTHNSSTKAWHGLVQWDAYRAAGRLGDGYLVTESIFSMTAQTAWIDEYVESCKRLDACLIVDEAHSFGLYGEDGTDLPDGGFNQASVKAGIHVRIIPLGKAAGTQGALVAGSAVMGRMLENFARPLIYSTAPSPILAKSVLLSLQRLARAAQARHELTMKAYRFKEALGFSIASATNIFPVQPEEQSDWPLLLKDAEKERLWIKPIRYPTVPKEEQCLRLTLHANQEQPDIERLLVFAKKYRLKPLPLSQDGIVAPAAPTYRFARRGLDY